MVEACAKIKMRQEEASEEHIRQLLAQMTVEEKCMQIGQIVSEQGAKGGRWDGGRGDMLVKSCKGKELISDTSEGPLIG